MNQLRRLLWMVKNWRYRWIAVAEEGVYVFEVGDIVRGMHVHGPNVEAMRAELDTIYAGRQWDSAHGRWVDVG